ncbi:ABC transporter permease [Corynebacterium pygosceleis]|uniref:ABC transporter permease n=1 Tax=Corynebacterium pygosceleis TaxID=2800406 RepID=UPI002002F4B5|nr:FtsX-like permease family protein [Corynebacterium pygosceleis]
MIRLAVAQLRHRGLRYLSLFFSIFAAVALTVATAAITTTLQRTVGEIFDRPYTNTDVVVTLRNSDGDDDPLAAIRAVPGVTDAVFDRTFRGAVADTGSVYRSTYVQSVTDGPLRWRTLTEGSFPTSDDEVIATGDDHLIGQELFLEAPGIQDPARVRIVGRAERSAQEQLIGSESILATPTAVDTWAGGSRVGEIRVAAAPGTTPTALAQAIREALPASTTDVTTAAAHTAELSDRYLSQRDRYFLLLAVFIAVVAAVAGLVIFSAFSVLTGQRQREFALLRSTGASTAQILLSVIVEATILATLAGALGAPSGLLLARTAGEHADALGVRVPLAEVTLPGTWMVSIVALGVMTAVLAALPAGRSAVRRPVTQSLAAQAVSQQGALRRVSLLLLGSATTIAGFAAATVVPGLTAKRAVIGSVGSAGLIALGTLIVLAVALPALVNRLSRVMGALPVPTLQLGAAFVGRQVQRSGAIVAIIFAGVTLVSAVFHGQDIIRTHLTEGAHGTGDIDVTVTALDESVPDGLVASIRNTDGVTAAIAPAAARVVNPWGTAENVLALDQTAGEQLLRGGTGAAPGEIIVGDHSAIRDRVKEGHQVQLTIFDETVTATVRYGAGRTTFIAPELVDAARTRSLEDKGVPVDTAPPLPRPAILVRIDGPANQPADGSVPTAVTATIAQTGARVSVAESFSARREIAATADRILTMSTLMTLVATLIAGVGVANTVTLAVRERKRDRELLGALGMTRGGQIIMPLTEITVLSVPTAFIAATTGGALGLWIGTTVTSRADGTWPLLRPDTGTILEICLAALLVTCVFTLTALPRHRRSP